MLLHVSTRPTCTSEKSSAGGRSLALVRTVRMIGSHVAGGAGFFHRRVEIPMNDWIFVLELDLAAALFDAGVGCSLAVLHPHEAKAPAAPPKRQIAGGLCAGVEMLMKPLVRRHYDAPRLPVHSLHWLTFGPENGVTL